MWAASCLKVLIKTTVTILIPLKTSISMGPILKNSNLIQSLISLNPKLWQTRQINLEMNRLIIKEVPISRTLILKLILRRVTPMFVRAKIQ